MGDEECGSIYRKRRKTEKRLIWIKLKQIFIRNIRDKNYGTEIVLFMTILVCLMIREMHVSFSYLMIMLPHSHSFYNTCLENVNKLQNYPK